MKRRKKGDKESSKSLKGVVGFRNLGNTCFMNSSIQCLSNTIPLTDYFLRNDYQHEINPSNVFGTGGGLVAAYANLMQEIWCGNSSVISPKEFKRKLARFAPRFAGARQHDSQEFLSFLLDGIHEDLNRVIKKPYIEDVEGDGTNDEKDSMKAWQNYLKRNKSIIVDIFQGQLRTTLECQVCSHRVIKFDPFMYLSLPLSNETRSLDDCLKLFCQEEALTGENQWYCSKCKKHVDATMQTDLWTLPPILIVHLKRFQKSGWSGRCSKLTQSIRFKLRNWDLDQYVARHTTASPMYDLYAVSNHHGMFGSGHYTAYAINRIDDEWYNFNDSRASKVSESQVASNDDAYVLFFNRVVDEVDTNGESQPNNDAVPSVSASRAPVILRQSSDRPEHWPHLMTDETLRNYKRPHCPLPVMSPRESEGHHEHSTAESESLPDAEAYTDSESMSDADPKSDGDDEPQDLPGPLLLGAHAHADPFSRSKAESPDSELARKMNCLTDDSPTRAPETTPTASDSQDPQETSKMEAVPDETSKIASISEKECKMELVSNETSKLESVPDEACKMELVSTETSKIEPASDGTSKMEAAPVETLPEAPVVIQEVVKTEEEPNMAGQETGETVK